MATVEFGEAPVPFADANQLLAKTSHSRLNLQPLEGLDDFPRAGNLQLALLRCEPWPCTKPGNLSTRKATHASNCIEHGCFRSFLNHSFSRFKFWSIFLILRKSTCSMHGDGRAETARSSASLEVARFLLTRCILQQSMLCS